MPTSASTPESPAAGRLGSTVRAVDEPLGFVHLCPPRFEFHSEYAALRVDPDERSISPFPTPVGLPSSEGSNYPRLHSRCGRRYGAEG